MYLTIGSGDIKDLLAGQNTKQHSKLWDKFLSDDRPHYNARNTPIDQLRTGAILEERYYDYLPDYYLAQGKITSKEMDVLTVTLDFSSTKSEYFEELKSVYFDDFIILQKEQAKGYKSFLNFIKKRYSIYYNQIQSQLYATGYNIGCLTFIVVYSYVDADNLSREIKPNELIKIMVPKDKNVISDIKHRLTPFQQVKDFYTKNIIK